VGRAFGSLIAGAATPRPREPAAGDLGGRALQDSSSRLRDKRLVALRAPWVAGRPTGQGGAPVGRVACHEVVVNGRLTTATSRAPSRPNRPWRTHVPDGAEGVGGGGPIQAWSI
jgi:hypothetical protein